jgi:DNA polymerase I
VRLHLLEANGYIHRGYHATPALTKKDGTQINAVFAWATMLWGILEAFRLLPDDQRPTHIGVVFDLPGQTFRHKLYPEYKGQRNPHDNALVDQFSLCRAATLQFGLNSIAISGHEADDIIATICRIAREQDHYVTIASSDKDMMQLVEDPWVRIYNPMSQSFMGETEVRAKFGVEPKQMVDFLAMVGDAADNIPGIQGVGPKIAARLLHTYGSLDVLAQAYGTIDSDNLRRKVMIGLPMAMMSRRLVQLDSQVPLYTSSQEDWWGRMKVRPIPAGLVAYLKSMEFTSLANRVEIALRDPFGGKNACQDSSQGS